MRIYRVTLTEKGTLLKLASHLGVANNVEEAMALCLEEWLPDEEVEFPGAEVSDIECLGECDFTGVRE